MTRKQRTINIALWLAQASLASALLFSGFIKLTQPSTDIVSIWRWTVQYQDAVWLVGAVEVVLGIGILIPELLRIAMRVTVWAAYACVMWTIAFGIFLVLQKDLTTLSSYFPNLLLGAFVAWGRQNPHYTTPH